MRYPEKLILSILSHQNRNITYYGIMSECYRTVGTDDDHEAMQRLYDEELLLKVITDYNYEAKKAEYINVDYELVIGARSLLVECRNVLTISGSKIDQLKMLERGTAECIAAVAKLVLEIMNVLRAENIVKPAYQVQALSHHLIDICKQCLTRYEVVIYND